MEILKAFRSGMDTVEIARLFRMKEPQVYSFLHQEMDRARITRSAVLPGRRLRDHNPDAVSPALGPGGTPFTREETG